MISCRRHSDFPYLLLSSQISQLLPHNFLFDDEEDAPNKFSRKETHGNVSPPRSCAPRDASAKSAVPALSGILLGIEETIYDAVCGDSECGRAFEAFGACWTVLRMVR